MPPPLPPDPVTHRRGSLPLRRGVRGERYFPGSVLSRGWSPGEPPPPIQSAGCAAEAFLGGGRGSPTTQGADPLADGA